MKRSIEDVIITINEALAESGKTPVEVAPKEILGVPTDQLPPYVAEMEEKMFEGMLDDFVKLHGSDPSPDVLEAIRFIAKAEAVRRHTYRKLAMTKLDDYPESESDTTL